MRAVFYEKMRKDVERELADANRQCEVILKTMTKRNDINMTGLMVVTEGEPVSPTLYLGEFYDQYREGRDYADILNQVVGMIREADPPKLVPEQLLDFDQIKDNVFIRVADRKQNQHWLKDKLYHVVDDLACTYHLWFKYLWYVASISIGQAHLDAWGVTADEVRAVAESNLLRENVQFRDMNDVLKTYLEESGDETLQCYTEDFSVSEPGGLYVLKTDRECYGANVILRKDVMKRISKRFNDDFYILPSSQHEVIVISVKQSPPFEALQRMVKEINEEEVEPQDRLSDDLFYYDRERGRVMKAKEYYAEKLGMSIEELDSEFPEKKRHRDEMER